MQRAVSELEKTQNQIDSESADDLHSMINPSAYDGLYAFHKYWGKKPNEPLRFLVNLLTQKGDTVCDPFIGSGAIAREAADLERHFIGGDLNPFSVKLSKFIAQPCARQAYLKEIKRIRDEVKDEIDASYGANETTVVSHILWVHGQMSQVWERPLGKRKRMERAPNERDLALSSSYSDCIDIGTRPLVMFDNSRINTKQHLTWADLFTCRAMRNIRILKDSILKSPRNVQNALELTLTSSIGQMSNMVFAITSRGKAAGLAKSKVEVGSWVIGYWRPDTHFEINVWNCFESKASKLSKGLPESEVDAGAFAPIIKISDAISLMEELSDESIDLVITDPPHGDRIPYLELSELWNATLAIQSNLDKEIVVSNAKGRNKSVVEYDQRMTAFFSEASRKLKNGGSIALFFNSRRDEDWDFIRRIAENAEIEFIGAFPMSYSARSVVQDNREGSMKSDFILIFSRGRMVGHRLKVLQSIPGWKNAAPVMEAAE